MFSSCVSQISATVLQEVYITSKLKKKRNGKSSEGETNVFRILRVEPRREHPVYNIYREHWRHGDSGGKSIAWRCVRGEFILPSALRRRVYIVLFCTRYRVACAHTGTPDGRHTASRLKCGLNMRGEPIKRRINPKLGVQCETPKSLVFKSYGVVSLFRFTGLWVCYGRY